MAVIAQGKEPPKPVDRDWPAFRYPPGGDPSSGKVFNAEADVPKGWLDAPSRPAPPPAPPVVKTSAKKSDPQEESRWRREAVENAQRLVATEADRDTLKARVGALEAFIARVGEDENCPEPLKAVIAELLPPAAEAEPEAASKPKRAAKA